MPPKRLTAHDIADTTLWPDGEITAKGETLKVKFIPDSRQKLALEEVTQDFYWYDRKRDQWRHVQHGIYALRRMLRHMEHTHSVELPTLEQVQVACNELGLEFCDLRASNVDSPESKIAKAKLQAFIEALGKVLDEDKVDAQEHMNRIVVLDYRDSRGRVNTGVVMCRTATAAQRLRQRINSIRSMDAWITFYGAIIERLIEEMELHLREAKKFLGLFIKWVYDEDFKPTNTRRLKYYFDEYAFHVSRLAIKPYLRSAIHLRREIGMMGELTQKGVYVTAAAEIGRTSLMAIELLHQRGPLERIKLHLRRATEGVILSPALQGRLHIELERIAEASSHIDDRRFQRPVTERLVSEVNVASRNTLSQNWSEALTAVDNCLNMI
jgi:hypothetical protein